MPDLLESLAEGDAEIEADDADAGLGDDEETGEVTADFDAMAKDYASTGDPASLKAAILACLQSQQGYESEESPEISNLAKAAFS